MSDEELSKKLPEVKSVTSDLIEVQALVNGAKTEMEGVTTLIDTQAKSVQDLQIRDAGEFVKEIEIDPVSERLEKAQKKLAESLRLLKEMDEKELDLLVQEIPSVDKSMSEATSLGEQLTDDLGKVKPSVESGLETVTSEEMYTSDSWPFGPTAAKGLFGVMSTVSPVIEGASKLGGYLSSMISSVLGYDPSDRVEGSREHALRVLREIEDEDKVTTAAVARLAVGPFFATAGNIAAGQIGEHYEEIRDGLLRKPPTDANLRELATNETINFWNKQPGLAGYVGSAMSKDSRFEILKKCRDEQWIRSLGDNDLGRWDKAQEG